MAFWRARFKIFIPLAAVACAAACNRQPPTNETHQAPSGPIASLDYLTSSTVGNEFSGRPWITHVNAVDLDRDGHMDVLACDGPTNQVVWFRQGPLGQFTEIALASDMRAPVHVEAVDFEGDDDLDVLVASMGQVLPNTDRIGAVIVLENDGAQKFTSRVLLEKVARVTDLRAADFNGDGRLDLAVAHFGYHQGEVAWMERVGPWEFKRHVLLDLSGAINTCIADMDGSGTPDIVVLVSQQWEEIYLFANDGRGNFSRQKIYGSTNPDYGSSGISIADMNGDARPDVLYTNGDGFDYATPGPRPWHGVQWLENMGGGDFRYHRIGDLPGAYSPIGVDLDSDGDMDVIATSAFAKWENSEPVSLMMFENDGGMRFTPRILARTPTHLVTAVAVDLDGAGRPALITGGFHVFPPFDQLSRVRVWRRTRDVIAP